jgi:tetratricopeptide (TPR) repeat protein
MINKQRIYYIITEILLTIIIGIVISAVFIVNRDLAHGIVSGKYFWFYASMALFSMFAIPAVIVKGKEKLSFKVPDLLILLFCLAAVLITFHYTGRLINKCLLLIFAMAFYFYLRIFLAGKSKLIYNLCEVTFVITGMVEAVWGLMQLYGFTSSQHNLFKITGSFFNPGPYSGWLAIVFPMALGFSLKGIINHKRREVTQNSPDVAPRPSLLVHVSSLLTVLCIILILPAAMSRASWLAALGGCAFIGIIYGIQNKKIIGYCKKYRKRVFILLFIAFTLTIVAFVGLFLLKKDSASGRAFTWKIALQTIQRNPMGVGLDNFGGSYGNVQAEYFASDAGTEREEYVAEGVEYAFNEYLQICIEMGIIPFLIFLAFVVYVLVLGVRNKNILPAGSLVALLIFASMSYPFNVLPFVIAFVFLSALCMVNNNAEKPKKKELYVMWTFLIVAPVTIALCIYKIYPSYEAYKQWNKTKIIYNINMHEAASEEYSKQYLYLQDEIKFLFEYTQSLSKSEQYEKSNEVLRRAMQISCDPMLYNIMGKNYQALKEYRLAEQNFTKAVNLVPNRLYPHYLLAKLYHETGQNNKAEIEINIVLTKPSKVESMAVKEMRQEIRELRTKKVGRNYYVE